MVTNCSEFLALENTTSFKLFPRVYGIFPGIPIALAGIKMIKDSFEVAADTRLPFTFRAVYLIGGSLAGATVLATPFTGILAYYAGESYWIDCKKNT